MICNDGEVDLNQKIYKCDSCQISVHQNCYGISQNEQEWKCDLCKKFPEENKRKLITCILCSKNGGAMKQIELPSDSYFAKTLEN